jgi:hypothetical protein
MLIKVQKFVYKNYKWVVALLSVISILVGILRHSFFSSDLNGYFDTNAPEMHSGSINP